MSDWTPKDGTPEEIQTPETDSSTETKIDREKRYKDAQADVTKSRQELAELKKAKESTEQPQEVDDDAQAKKWMKEQGYATQEEIEKRFQAEQWFRDILVGDPTLKQHEQAIRDLQKTTGKAYEDIIVEYNFSSKDKLSKAMEQGGFAGNKEPSKPSKKPMSQMTMEEFAKWEKDNLRKGGAFTKAWSF